MSAAPPIGVVLAGGAGSRIGGSKATVMLGGRPLISYPLAALRAVLADVAVVAKADTSLPPLGEDVPVWREPDEPRHPLMGIVEALRRADGRPVVVLACDMPRADEALVRVLVTADARGAPAVVAVTAKGGPQPLCARYEPAALAALAGFDPAGRAVAQVQALAPATLAVPDDLLRNVNTPEDLADAEHTAGA